MKTIVLTAAVLATFTGAALAHPGHSHAKKPASTAKAASLICPVTGTKIASIKAAVGHSTYKGKTYYFCCPECKPRFDKDPAKVVASAAHGNYQPM